MALLPTGWIKMPGDNDETKRFAWSHVKSIFYNKAANILLKDKLDEMDKIIDEKIAKALMSNVQVNDQGKIPTSALTYAMQQSITKNGQYIAKLNSDFKANRWTKRINILSFTESWYTCPSDGYLFANTNGVGINFSAGIYLNDTYQKISISPNSFSCLFMKQGMKIKIEVNDISKFTNAFFCPFGDWF